MQQHSVVCPGSTSEELMSVVLVVVGALCAKGDPVHLQGALLQPQLVALLVVSTPLPRPRYMN